jgi:DNA-binding GntR family transcriptional regulator
LSIREIVDLFEALGGVEGMAAEVTAVRMSAADLETLAQLQVKIEQRHRTKARLEYFHDNQKLHESIVRFSGNSAIVDIHARLIARRPSSPLSGDSFGIALERICAGTCADPRGARKPGRSARRRSHAPACRPNGRSGPAVH